MIGEYLFYNFAYSESPKITEEEFLRREFGINTVYVSTTEDFLRVSEKSGIGITIVVSANPNFWIPTLNKLKKNSVIFILIGNETYDPKVFNSLNDLKSLRHAFVYNLPTTISVKNIVGPIIGNIYDGGLGKTTSVGSVFRDARISYSLKVKFKNINIRYPYSRFPQGYSNNFAKIVKRIGFIESNSLLSKSFNDLIVAARENIYDFAFIGQPTNRRREIFLKNIKNLSRSVVLYNNEFKGIYEDNDETYLNQLLSAKFILVPPGFYNNSNHRYTESLICGALPVILSNNSLDPSTNTNWTNQLLYLNRYSVRAQVRYLTSIDNNQYQKFYKQAKADNLHQIAQTKNLVSEIIG